MKNLAIWITTTFDRQSELNACIKSLRDNGVKNTIHIFAEPVDWKKKYEIKDKNIKMHINKERLWCFRNFHKMLVTLVGLWTKYIRLGQDDFVYEPWLSDKLKQIVSDSGSFWYYAMTTRPRMEKHIYKNWWNTVKLWRFARWMNYIMRTDAANIMIRHPFYQNHLMTYTKNQQVDSCVSYVLSLLKLPMYYHNPSLSYHKWESTIGHVDRYEGYLFKKDCPRTMVGVASIPNREKELQKCIESLYNQADRIVVGLNWYESIPSFLKKPWIEVIMWDNSLGDAIKFAKVHEVATYDYYFSVDDDLFYPVNYIQSRIERIEKYNRKAIVWTHWVVVPGNKISTYYNNCVRYTYKSFLPTDNFVNVLGTWTIAFHKDTIKLSLKDFPKPNMADIRLWIKAQKEKIPMVCLKHNGDEIQTMNTNGSIWEDKHNEDGDITDIVNSIRRWVQYMPQVLDTQ